MWVVIAAVVVVVVVVVGCEVNDMRRVASAEAFSRMSASLLNTKVSIALMGTVGKAGMGMDPKGPRAGK
jgi:hypothetical protein